MITPTNKMSASLWGTVLLSMILFVSSMERISYTELENKLGRVEREAADAQQIIVEYQQAVGRLHGELDDHKKRLVYLDNLRNDLDRKTQQHDLAEQRRKRWEGCFDTQAKIADLLREKANALQGKADALQEKADTPQEKVDERTELQENANALQETAKALQDKASALQSKVDKLRGKP